MAPTGRAAAKAAAVVAVASPLQGRTQPSPSRGEPKNAEPKDDIREPVRIRCPRCNQVGDTVVTVSHETPFQTLMHLFGPLCLLCAIWECIFSTPARYHACFNCREVVSVAPVSHQEYADLLATNTGGAIDLQAIERRMTGAVNAQMSTETGRF